MISIVKMEIIVKIAIIKSSSSIAFKNTKQNFVHIIQMIVLIASMHNIALLHIHKNK